MYVPIARRISWFLLTAFLVLVMFSVHPALAQQFASIDIPGAASTGISQINNLGQMAGAYTDEAGVTHGVLLSAGVVTTLDYPGAAATVCQGINDSGQIVGLYFNSDQVAFGFLWVNGTFTPVSNPAYAGTYPLGIDDLGNIVGQGIDNAGVSHGFVLSKGVYTNIDYPGAIFTQVEGTNLRGGSLTGAYAVSESSNLVGFTYINGQFASVTYPSSTTTNLNDINNGGQVVGNIPSPSSSTNYQSFLLSGTTFTPENFPGAISTVANGLNDLSQVVGWYLDANNIEHGFLSSPGPFAYVAQDGIGVAVLDTSTNALVTTISLPGAFALAITPDQKHVYVANAGTNAADIIDTATNTVEATTVPVGKEPFAVAVAPNGNFVYVANLADNTVSVISTATNTVVATVPVGTEPVSIAVTPDSNFVYVSNLESQTISVISAASNTVTATVHKLTNPWQIAITPNGADVYASQFTFPGVVSVISTESNLVTSRVQLGQAATGTEGAAITPDGAFGYFTNFETNNVSVVNLATNTVIATIPVGASPFSIASSPDGSLIYVGDLGDTNVSVIQTSTNTVTATIPVTYPVSSIAIASATPTSQTVTQPLSPTAPNVFSFGTNSQTVTYPPGTSFSNVVMNTVAQQITQAQFQQRVAGTEFSTAACIVYSGNGGNCVDYLVTCTNTSGKPITCPARAQPTIGVETDFSTSQSITNPGYLTTPIGENNWQNIFVSFSDPKVKGKTKGFSEFIAVDLGATNPQGLAKFKIRYPATTKTITSGSTLQIAFKLSSVANGSPITDAQAGISVTQIADGTGKAVSVDMLTANNVFKPTGTPGVYAFGLCTKRGGNPYPAGTYTVNIYGNAFAAYEFQFKVAGP